jgi:hypothetical protein
MLSGIDGRGLKKPARKRVKVVAQTRNADITSDDGTMRY